jgi:hypothetical protein
MPGGAAMTPIEYLKLVVTLYNSGATASVLLKHIALRRRNPQSDTVRRLMQVCGKGTRRVNVVRILRTLENAGFGKLIVGRRGHESRFVWGQA